MSEIQDQRDTALRRGRQLAAAILSQLERFYLAPGNLEEGRKLDGLQAAFMEWEQRAHIQFPDIDTLAEFPNAGLRPAPKKIADERSYQFLRRQWTLDELRALPARLEQAKKSIPKDSGMWGGIPGI